MPIYEYRCSGCGARVEVLVRGGSEAPRCPHCGAPLTEKLLSTAFVSSRRAGDRAGHTCCGREERCDRPPCSSEGACARRP